MSFLNMTWDNYVPTMDYLGHGTHCAGAVATSGLILGVAPNVSIVNVKVIDARGYGYLSWVIKGLYYAAKNRIPIASTSFGGIP